MGIIQHLGKVAGLKPADFGAVLRIDARGWGHRPQHGDSIAVDGACLTHAPPEIGAEHEGVLVFNLIHQTLNSTNLGRLRPGDAVNLEHALTLQTLLSGHIVQGHVDGVGRVLAVVREDGQWRVRIAAPAPPPGLEGSPDRSEAMRCIVERGSIAVNGVSLTVAAVGKEWFEVALIPTTLELTNLSSLAEGSQVNLELDYLAKIVVNALAR